MIIGSPFVRPLPHVMRLCIGSLVGGLLAFKAEGVRTKIDCSKCQHYASMLRQLKPISDQSAYAAPRAASAPRGAEEEATQEMADELLLLQKLLAQMTSDRDRMQADFLQRQLAEKELHQQWKQAVSALGEAEHVAHLLQSELSRYKEKGERQEAATVFLPAAPGSYTLLDELTEAATGAPRQGAEERSPQRALSVNSLTSLDGGRMAELEDELASLQKGAHQLALERDRLRDEIHLREMAEKDLLHQWAETKRALQEEKRVSRTLQQELEVLRENGLRQETTELHDARRATASQTHQIHMLLQSKAALEEKLQEIEKANQEYLDDNHTLQRQSRADRARLSLLQQRNDTLSGELGDLNAEVLRLMEKNLDLQRQLGMEHAREENLSDQITHLQAGQTRYRFRGLVGQVMTKKAALRPLLDEPPTPLSAQLSSTPLFQGMGGGLDVVPEEKLAASSDES